MRPNHVPSTPALRRRSSHPLLILALGLALLLALALARPLAAEARGLQIGFMDDLYSGAQSDEWLDRTKTFGADLIRVNARWSLIAEKQPDNPSDHRDPAYNFSHLDRTVRGATARGMQVLVTVYGAPRFAEGNNRPGDAPAGTWKPRPGQLKAFGTALARRYSGGFNPLDGGGVLPFVRYYAAWNEPNLRNYLNPQWKGKTPVGARHARKMLNAFYDGVKSVNRAVRVTTGATSPFGDDPGGQRMRPQRFIRELLCLRLQRGKLKTKSCPNRANRARFDILAHHPINVDVHPARAAAHRDDGMIGNFGQIRKALRFAERKRTTGTRGKHQLWAAEVWWQTKPPQNRGVSRNKHARFTSEGLFELWRQGADAVVFLQFRDSPYDPKLGYFFNYQTGVFAAGGKRKPTYQAARFPFVSQRKKGKKVLLWGRSPRAGRVVIQHQRGKRWKRIATRRVGVGGVFRAKTKLPRKGKKRLRARVGGENSRVWVQKR